MGASEEKSRIGRNMWSDRQKAVLESLGIELWYKRSPVAETLAEAEPAATEPELVTEPDTTHDSVHEPVVEPVPEPVTEPAPEPVSGPVQPVAFGWIKGESLVLVAHDPWEKTLERFLKDVVIQADRLAGAESNPVSGEFRWPQVLGESQNPERALRAWFDKHVTQTGGPSRWVGGSSPIVQELTGLLPGFQLEDVGDLSSVLKDPDAKRLLWQRIRNKK